MQTPDSYLYFLAFLPEPELRAWLAALKEPTGQFGRGVADGRLHLTVCVLAQTEERAPFIAPRVEAALSGAALASAPLRFGRVRGGKTGAALHTRGGKHEYHALQAAIFARLAARELTLLYDKKHPHITLGHQPCRFEPFKVVREWVPQQLVLIESEVGATRHNLLGSWPLLAPVQGSFPFEPEPDPQPLFAAGGWR